MKKNSGFNRWRFAALFAGLLAIAGGAAKPARAQLHTDSVPRYEVSGDYTYIRANAGNSSGGFSLNGGSGSLAYNFTDRFSAIAEFSGSHFNALPNNISSSLYTYLFGPRVSLRKSDRWTPFAQALFGAGRLTASSAGLNAGENSFAMALGAGVDFHFLHSHFSFRPVEADYLFTRFDNVSGNSEKQNNLRISSGIVFRFGSR